jgi:histidine triad (HIT) family protein
MDDCLFCRIVRKELPAKVVLETEQTLAFRDVNPKAPTHVLVIPKEHIASLLQLESRHAAMLGELHATIQSVAREEKLSGFRVVVNTGKDSGQTVDHLHYHVLAGRRLAWPPG